MMRGLRWMVLLTVAALGGTLFNGCAPEPVKAPPPPPAIIPAAPGQESMVQADFSKLDPKVRIGRVALVSSDHAIAVVSGIVGDDVKKGSSIQFMDSRQMGIANGTVWSVDKTTDPANPYLIVDYTPTPSGRAPVKGDLAFFDPR